jgi:hypothetical protein
MEDLASSGTSIPTDASEEPAAAKDSELQMFELLDSRVCSIFLSMYFYL